MKKTTSSQPRRQPSAATVRPEGEVTHIDVPKPPSSAINKERPISDLIKGQLRHIQHAENARLPRERRSEIKIEDIHTESEAAKYIRKVTHLLHPRRRKRSTRKPTA